MVRPLTKKTSMKKLLFILALISTQLWAQKDARDYKATFLGHLSWTSAAQILTPSTVVVIPLGAEAKEHGPHLPLSTDFLQANGFTDILAKERSVVIAPTVNYSFYNGFLKYPGSTSLDFTTSVNMIVNIASSLAAYGPRRFYVINIGVSTTPALAAAAKILAQQGILLYYSDYERPNFVKAKPIKTSDYDTHAGELETSKVLFFRPDMVDMTKAVNESATSKTPGMMMSPEKSNDVVYNASGIIGDAKLGTPDKGKRYIDAMAKEMISEIDSITVCGLPTVRNMEAAFKKYEGEWTRPGKSNFTVEVKNNALWVKPVDQQLPVPFPLYAHDDGYFVGTALTMVFVEDENGKVIKAWCQGVRGNYWSVKLK